MENDGLYLPTIKRHSLEKIRRHNYYAQIFSKAMHRKWPQRAYVGLYSGAGRARLADTGEIVETSAMSVFTQEVPFTKYIFVDEDSRCVEALEARIAALPRGFDVTIIHGTVNNSVDAVIDAMPSYNSKDRGLISLCFVDPFGADLDFGVIRRLSDFLMDFLVLLPLGHDLRRNFLRYLRDEEDERVGRLIDAPNWRTEWRARGESDKKFIRFILSKFDEAMVGLGFRKREMKDTVSIKIAGMGVYLYSLALYSRHEAGEKFWKTTIAGTDPQLGLALWGDRTTRLKPRGRSFVMVVSEVEV